MYCTTILQLQFIKIVFEWVTVLSLKTWCLNLHLYLTKLTLCPNSVFSFKDKAIVKHWSHVLRVPWKFVCAWQGFWIQWWILPLDFDNEGYSWPSLRRRNTNGTGKTKNIRNTALQIWGIASTLIMLGRWGQYFRHERGRCVWYDSETCSCSHAVQETWDIFYTSTLCFP